MARQRLDAEQSRNLILDAVERLMHRDGYAAVNTRSVALEASVKPPLVHYHFDTTDNLLLAACRRSAARAEELLRRALASQRPLRALWNYHADPVRTALATQFMALAHERASVREEIGRNVVRFRCMEGEALVPLIEAANPASRGFSPSALAMFITALGRTFVLESTIGISEGHDSMRSWIDRFIDEIEPPGENSVDPDMDETSLISSSAKSLPNTPST